MAVVESEGQKQKFFKIHYIGSSKFHLFRQLIFLIKFYSYHRDNKIFTFSLTLIKLLYIPGNTHITMFQYSVN